MGEQPQTVDGDGSTTNSVETEASRTPPQPSDTPDLQLTVVQYDNESDRGTIHPPGLRGVERMETWLSADVSAFVGLSAWR